MIIVYIDKNLEKIKMLEELNYVISDKNDTLFILLPPFDGYDLNNKSPELRQWTYIYRTIKQY